MSFAFFLFSSLSLFFFSSPPSSLCLLPSPLLPPSPLREGGGGTTFPPAEGSRSCWIRRREAMRPRATGSGGGGGIRGGRSGVKRRGVPGWLAVCVCVCVCSQCGAEAAPARLLIAPAGAAGGGSRWAGCSAGGGRRRRCGPWRRRRLPARPQPASERRRLSLLLPRASEAHEEPSARLKLPAAPFWRRLPLAGPPSPFLLVAPFVPAAASAACRAPAAALCVCAKAAQPPMPVAALRCGTALGAFCE